MLAESALDRASITAAVRDIANCGDLGSDQQTLQSAANSRTSLLSQLQQGQWSTLPVQVIEYLTTAWHDSIASDQSYAGWADDELTSGCSNNDTSDSNYQDAQGTDASSTNAKTNFVSYWNPIASEYGLPQLTPYTF